MLVAKSASAAPQNDLSAVLSGHIGDDLAGLSLLDLGYPQHLDEEIITVLAVAVALAALFSGLCRKLSAMTVIRQGV